MCVRACVHACKTAERADGWTNWKRKNMADEVVDVLFKALTAISYTVYQP